MPTEDSRARSSWEDPGDGLSQREVTGEKSGGAVVRHDIRDPERDEDMLEDRTREDEVSEEGRRPRMARTAQRVS